MPRCVVVQPARCPCCFYGYVICVLCGITQMQAMIGTSSFFAFVVPFMLSDPLLDLTPGSLGGMYAVGGVLGAFASPFFGKLVDVYGSRSCLPFGFLGLCLAMQVLSHATNAPMVMIGFFMSRLFSIGALNPWCQVTLNQWFDRKRGRVMGTMMVITTFIRSGPYAVAYENAIEVFGWRTTQQYGSISCLILAVPVVLLIFYRPEDVGCLPDGAKPEEREGLERAEARADEQRSLISDADEDEEDEEGERQEPASQYQPPPPAARRDYTLHEALRTSAFYLLNADTLVGWMFGAGIGFHMVSIINVSNGGSDVDVALHVYFPMGIASAATNFATGYLLDWGKARPQEKKDACFLPKYILVAVDILQGGTMMFLPAVDSVPRAMAFGVSFGIASGARQIVQATTYAELFGRTHLGAIQGSAQSVNILGTGLGPFILGQGYDYSHSFGPVLRLVALLPLAMSVVQFCFLRPPSRAGR